MVPLNAEYIFVSNKKIEFSGGLGLYLGYIYSQQLENPLAKDQSGGIILPPFERFTDINMFDDFYVGANAGVSLRIFFNKKLSLFIRPGYLYQLRGKSENDDLVGTNRLGTISFEIGLFYSFGTKSKKEKEGSTTPKIP